MLKKTKFSMNQTPHIRDILPSVTGKTFKKHGFNDHRIMSYWHEIMGESLAHLSQPVSLSRKTCVDGEGGVLTVKVEGAMALEVQHLSPFIIDKINGYYGYKIIAKIKIIQGVLSESLTYKQPTSYTEHEVVNLSKSYQNEIDSPDLCKALARLKLCLEG